MAIQLQLRKGTKVQNDTFTGAEAELSYDTTTKGLRIHDGTTQGGNIIDTVVFFQAPTAENNYTWARKYASGWVEQGGISPTTSITAGNSGSVSITYPIEMSDSNYTASLTLISGDYGSLKITRNTTGGSVAMFNRSASGTYNYQAMWQVSGMAA